ncbi:hypothetical protein K492DRAFT_239418 [Lichtheimia hyalospora FSU 10163]|nr:hypothetical protein K492DRAFT_239418 [Lichtheimia hyalospora FSU 10163]
MEAMKKAHVERVDHDAQLILDLSREIEQLKSATTSTNGHEKTPTEDPCVTAEDMVRAIEEELACLETQQDDGDSSDTMSSRSSPDTWDQQHTMDNISDTSAQNITSSDDSNVVSSLEQSLSPVPVESSSTSMVAESDISHKSPPSSHHHHQQQQRSFRPRSQTMDTLVKKASMFLLRPKQRSTAEQPQQRDSCQPRPTPSCTSPHPGSSYRTSSTGPVSPIQQHRDKPFSSRRSSVQNFDITTTATTSTPLFVNHKDKRRQSMLVLPSVASQHQPLGSMDNMTLDQSLSSSSSRSRLMYHYQQQQHAVQEYYQRRRRSAIVGGATPPFMGGVGELKSTTSEQWKISNNSSRR